MFWAVCRVWGGLGTFTAFGYCFASLFVWGQRILYSGSPNMWVVVKIMVPFWVPIIIRHLLFRVPKKGP